MATRTNIERAQERLKVKAEQLKLRVDIVDKKDKLKRINAQLKAMGGRVR